MVAIMVTLFCALMVRVCARPVDLGNLVFDAPNRLEGAMPRRILACQVGWHSIEAGVPADAFGTPTPMSLSLPLMQPPPSQKRNCRHNEKSRGARWSSGIVRPGLAPASRRGARLPPRLPRAHHPPTGAPVAQVTRLSCHG